MPLPAPVIRATFSMVGRHSSAHHCWRDTDSTARILLIPSRTAR
jgi:hypothetical protein